MQNGNLVKKPLNFHGDPFGAQRKGNHIIDGYPLMNIIDGHPSMNIIDGCPSMNINGYPSMNIQFFKIQFFAIQFFEIHENH